MKDIIPAKKQSPILGLTGMGGGVGSNLGGSAAKKVYADEVFSNWAYRGDNSASQLEEPTAPSSRLYLEAVVPTPTLFKLVLYNPPVT